MTDQDKLDLIKLHERIEALDAEKDKLKDDLAKSNEKSAWYKSPIVIAFAGLLTALGGKAEGIWDRVTEAQEDKQEDHVESRTHNTAYKIILNRQDELEDTFLTYSDAIIESLPRYQQRKVQRILSGEGFEVEEEVVEEVELISNDDELDPLMVEVTGEIPEPAPEAAPNLFEAIQLQIKNDDVDIDKLEDRFVKKRVRRKK